MNGKSALEVISDKLLQGCALKKLNGVQHKPRMPSICLKTLRFSSHLGIKVRHRGPAGTARVPAFVRFSCQIICSYLFKKGQETFLLRFSITRQSLSEIQNSAYMHAFCFSLLSINYCNHKQQILKHHHLWLILMAVASSTVQWKQLLFPLLLVSDCWNWLFQKVGS